MRFQNLARTQVGLFVFVICGLTLLPIVSILVNITYGASVSDMQYEDGSFRGWSLSGSASAGEWSASASASTSIVSLPLFEETTTYQGYADAYAYRSACTTRVPRCSNSHHSDNSLGYYNTINVPEDDSNDYGFLMARVKVFSSSQWLFILQGDRTLNLKFSYQKWRAEATVEHMGKSYYVAKASQVTDYVRNTDYQGRSARIDGYAEAHKYADVHPFVFEGRHYGDPVLMDRYTPP